uniref:uncharacterized protein LOC122601026 n=1 Tax=Erigeron canadensis TaxID=72917 RepID=UPI001CB90665|nr:uncharacterized protein LOC122601026 [Erigeron canadensis]
MTIYSTIMDATYLIPFGYTALQERKIRTDIQVVTVSANIDNKLYKATIAGHWWKAKAILETHKDAVRVAISVNGNTMLHLAVEKGQNSFVENLLNFMLNKKDIEIKNSDGQTALHIAAIVGNKCAAELLVQMRKELLNITDQKAHVPLFSAYHGMKLNTYVYLLEATEAARTSFQPPQLSLYPDSYTQNLVKLIITAIFTKQYDLASKMIKKYPHFATRNDQILMAIAITFPTGHGFQEGLAYPSSKKTYHKIVDRNFLLLHSFDVFYKLDEDILWKTRGFRNTYYSCPNCHTLFNISLDMAPHASASLAMLYVVWYPVEVPPFKNVEKMKKEYKEAKEILTLICDQIDTLSGDRPPPYSGPILEAVRQGAYEVVDEILWRLPDTIDCKDQEGHNVIQLAIINRSEKVYNLIYHRIKHNESYRTMVDSSKNNLVHLVGRLAPSFVLDRTTGAALQLQRELQWRKEVEKFMLPTELIEKNIYMETPDMVFTRQHADLVKEGEKWMKTTAESCSITAALIVTIVFAAAITVPGGSNQGTGIPLFKEEIAFTIFAVSDAISLAAAATALLVFLSILTTRFAEKDFLVSLPRRMIIGLCILFLSTAAMMVAFGAILFLVFCDQRPWMLAPIGICTCSPIAVIVFLQSPLVVDLILSTYSPIFGKKSYLDSCKTNPNNI